MAIDIGQLRRETARGRGAPGAALAAAADLVQLIAFVAAGVESALPIERIREILEVKGLRPHPAATGDLRGLLPLPSGATPLLDLGARLGGGETVLTRLCCALVLERPFPGGQPLALLVGEVRDLVSAPRADLAQAPRLGAAPGAFGEVARLAGRLLPILDLDLLLTADDEARAAAMADQRPATRAPGAPPPHP